MGDDSGGLQWEQHADWWQEHFTDGADPEYEEQILPMAERELAGATRVLDLGCGEGQVSRRIVGVSGQVVGIDPAWSQVRAAQRRGGGPDYLQATSTRLPFADAVFDGVVVCLVLEHVDDLDGVVGEIVRVLAPGGRLALFLNHPLLQAPGAAWVIDHTVEPPERSWRLEGYLSETSFVDEVGKGIFIRFVHRPLGRYVNTLIGAGLALTHIEEPAPPSGFLDQAPEYLEQAEIPRLLLLGATKPAE